MDSNIREYQKYLMMQGGGRQMRGGMGTMPSSNYEKYFAPKGNQLIKTGTSIVGGTLGAILGTLAAPGPGTAAGGALGSGLGTALGRALGGESVLGQGGLQEIGIDALLGGAFSGFGKAAKAAKAGQAALQMSGKELGRQTVKGLAEGAGVSTGKEVITQAATRAAQQTAPKNVFEKLAMSGQRAFQKEIGLQEGVKLQGRVLKPSQIDDLSKFIQKDLGVTITNSTKPGMILRNNEAYANTLRTQLDNALTGSKKVFTNIDATDVLNAAKKNYLPGTNTASKAIQKLEADVSKTITNGTPEALNKLKNSLDDIVNYSATNVTPEKQRVAYALRNEIKGKIGNAVPQSKPLLEKLSKSNSIVELLGASGRKEAGEVGSAIQRLERTARTAAARVGGAPQLQAALTAAGEKVAKPLTLRNILTRQAVAAGTAGAIGGQGQPAQPDMTGMEQGGMEDMTGMAGDMGTMGDMGGIDEGAQQQADIDAYFQGLALQDLQQTGGKRLSSIKAAYDLFGGGKAEKKSISQQNAERKLTQANRVLNTLQTQLQAAGGPQGLGGALSSGLASIPIAGGTLQPKVRAFQDLRQGAVAQLSKALGESGVLTDQDIQRALNLVPTITDSPEQAQIKFRALRSFLSTADAGAVGTDTRFNF